MDFGLWLFTMKHLGQTPDSAYTVWDQMQTVERAELEAEYKASSWYTPPKKKEPSMGFDLWLYAIKHMSQTMDSARTIYDHMPENQKKALMEEYESCEWDK